MDPRQMARSQGAVPPQATMSAKARGPVSSYLIDAGLIGPDEAQIEAITFSVNIDVTGNITSQTESTRVTPGYVFLMNRLLGSVSDPLVDSDVIDLVSFNVKNQGRNMSVFKRPISMILLAQQDHLLHWSSAYRFYESADISLDWTVDAARYAAAAPIAEKRFYVTLMGEIVKEDLILKK